MSRQRSQVSTLKFQARSNGLRAPSHRPLLIGETVLVPISIDGFQVSAFWQGDEVIAASIAHQILDASFLPPGMHIGKKGDDRDRHCESAKTRLVLCADALSRLAERPV